MDRTKLSRIDEELESSEVQALCFLCRDVIGRRELDRIKDAKYLFLKLEEIGLLKDSFLYELLNTIGRSDLLKYLETDGRQPKKTDESPVLSAYRVMLYKLYEDMTRENFEKLKFLLVDKVGRKNKDACRTALDLFAAMEQTGALSNTNLTELERALKDLDKQLASTVQHYIDGVRQQDRGKTPAHVSTEVSNGTSEPVKALFLVQKPKQLHTGQRSCNQKASPQQQQKKRKYKPPRVEADIGRVPIKTVSPQPVLHNNVPQNIQDTRRSATSAKITVRSSRTTIQDILCGDPTLILSKVHEKELITDREYNNLKSSNSSNVEKQMVELVDKMMNKGENTCQRFLDLLQTDDALRATFPNLQNIQTCNRNSNV